MLLLSMKRFGLLSIVLLAACGGSSSTDVSVQNVLGIPKGTKEGSGLTGEFTTILEVTKNGCAKFPSLSVPAEKSTQVLNAAVEHKDGVIVFKEIEGTLRGGVNFDNTYEVGGAITISRDGEQNVLQSVRIKGNFKDGNNFEGEGTERLIGQILGQEVDCIFDFTIKGIRKGVTPTA